jgi:hypothetical protein
LADLRETNTTLTCPLVLMQELAVKVNKLERS